MHYNYDLSIIIPSIRRENLVTLYNHTISACRRYNWEFIISSPFVPPPELYNQPNVKFVKDCGTPARAFHIATLISEGRFLTWLSDDAWVYPDSIDQAVDLLLSKDAAKDIIGMRYNEGVNHSGPVFADDYWAVKTHPDLYERPGCDRNWLACGVLLLSSEYYRYMGGLDLQYAHLNFCVHDLVFRAYRNGSFLYLSPSVVMNCDFTPNRTVENNNIIAAYVENDFPLFKAQYAVADTRPIRIDVENWRTSAVVWEKKSY